jgi:hypothetical protein
MKNPNDFCHEDLFLGRGGLLSCFVFGNTIAGSIDKVLAILPRQAQWQSTQQFFHGKAFAHSPVGLSPFIVPNKTCTIEPSPLQTIMKI